MTYHWKTYLHSFKEFFGISDLHCLSVVMVNLSLHVYMREHFSNHIRMVSTELFSKTSLLSARKMTSTLIPNPDINSWLSPQIVDRDSILILMHSITIKVKSLTCWKDNHIVLLLFVNWTARIQYIIKHLVEIVQNKVFFYIIQMLCILCV